MALSTLLLATMVRKQPMDMILIQDGLAAIGIGATLSALLWGLFVQREGTISQGIYAFAIGVAVFAVVLVVQWLWRLTGIDW